MAAANLLTDESIDEILENLAVMPPETVAGTTYTLIEADAGKGKVFTSSDAVTVTLPAGVLPVGAVLSLYWLGEGAVSIAAGAGASIEPAGASGISARYGSIGLWHRADGVYVVTGGAS